MNCPATEVLPLRTALERHFLALAIVTTTACVGMIVADAAERDDAVHVDVGDGAASVVNETLTASAWGQGS